MARRPPPAGPGMLSLASSKGGRRRRTPIGRRHGARARRRRPTGDLRGRLDGPVPGSVHRRRSPRVDRGGRRDRARVRAGGRHHRSAGRQHGARRRKRAAVRKQRGGERRGERRPDGHRAVTDPARPSRPGRPGRDAGDSRRGRHPQPLAGARPRGRARCAGRLRRPRHRDDRWRRRHERRRLPGAPLRHDAPTGGRGGGRLGEWRGRRLARRAPEGDRRDALAVVGGRLGRHAGDRHRGAPASRSPLRTHRHGDGVDVVDGRRRRSARSPPSFGAIARCRRVHPTGRARAGRRSPRSPSTGGRAGRRDLSRRRLRRPRRSDESARGRPRVRQAAWSMPWSPPTPHSDAS